MMPLYHAVAHGCKAGEMQKCYDEIYWARIARRGEYFSINQLGAFGSDLAALAAFFEQPWQRPAAQLREADQAILLNQVAVYLRSLSRLSEAVEPMQAGLDAGIKQQDWKAAAIRASNLSELTLSLGRVAAALRYAAQSIELAEHTGDTFECMVDRTKLAEALHQAGQLAASRALFAEAERLQAEAQPEYDKLYSLQGFQYCALLLNDGRLGDWETRPEPRRRIGRLVQGSAEEQGKRVGGAEGVEAALATCRAVRQRAETALNIVLQGSRNLLDIGLNHLTLGRTYLLEAALSAAPLEGAIWRQAQAEVGQSVALLRQAGTQHNLPYGLLAVAELGRTRAALAGADERVPFLRQAERALDEVELLAGRGDMVLFQVDAAIERAKLALLQEEKEAAAGHLARAQALVKATEAPYQPYVGQWAEWQAPASYTVFQPGQIVGYHRRNPEIAALLRLVAPSA